MVNLQQKTHGVAKRRVSFIVPDFKALGALSMQKAKSGDFPPIVENIAMEDYIERMSATARKKERLS